MMDGTGRVEVVRSTEARVESLPDASRTIWMSGATTGSPPMWAATFVTAAGFRTGPHYHTCRSIALLVRGRARFRHGEQLEHVVDLGPGDWIFVGPDVVHEEINPSDEEDAEFLLFRDGEGEVSVYLEEREPG